MRVGLDSKCAHQSLARPGWIRFAQPPPMNEQTEPTHVRLLIVDQLSLFRISLGHLLASERGFDVVGESGTPEEAFQNLDRAPVDLILLDYDLCTERCSDFISAARARGYEGKFLILAASLDARKSAMALKLGASGIFLKSEAPSRLLQAIRVVSRGEIWIEQRVVQLIAEELVGRYPSLDRNFHPSRLDNREQQVLNGIISGFSNRKIGKEIGLSESTVKNVVQRLFSKAGVKTRIELVRVALQVSPVEPGQATWTSSRE
jgi:two-component system, NarL family, nitrate/nitrite response regulator NarL